MITTDDFDWSLEVALPVREQLATTVYFNLRGEIVIRQKADVYDEGDTIILLAPGNGAPIAKALLAVEAELTRPTTAVKPRKSTKPESDGLPLLGAAGSR